MKIKMHKKFQKQYKKLPERYKQAVQIAIDHFRNNPFDPVLYNHTLTGEYAGMRSISAGFDLRLIFIEEDDYSVVVLIKVGSHSQLYR